MTFHPTRFPELAYAKIDKGEWSFFAVEGQCRVGPVYHSKAELLGDLTRYAKESWGLE